MRDLSQMIKKMPNTLEICNTLALGQDYTKSYQVNGNDLVKRSTPLNMFFIDRWATLINYVKLNKI